ncbi:MAG: trypsin-like peptidase domain-containing protein [Clostridia bacterium]|nr:trypsin-like peptidase domain-containing protein [Clostridia bacterium]
MLNDENNNIYDVDANKDAAPNPPEDSAQVNGFTDNTGSLPPTEPAASPADETAPGAPADADETGGYSMPNGADRYPYGQQNRRYAQNGQPPIGENYPYGGSKGGKKKPGAGLIVLLVLIALIVLAGVSGIVAASSGFSGLRQSPPAVTDAPLATERNSNDAAKTPDVTAQNGPSISLSEKPQSDTAVTDGLTPADIYSKIQESSVGLLVYNTSNGQLYSEGSGVIIGEDESGAYTYVITCAHVIAHSGTKIKVMTSDNTTYDAQIAGYDTRTDIGVVRIKKTGLQAAEFGQIESLRVGDYVYAIGNPGGSEFAGSFTNGMVSAIARPVSSSTGYTTKCIQHTAAINPGNSGGALVNSYGQVVGINSMKIVKADYEGMGFAVPSDIVQNIVNDLLKNGYIPDRPKLGITYLPATSNESYNMVVQLREYPQGSIVIDSISADSDLANTDAQAGDMIIAVNGKPLDSLDLLPSLIEKSKVGDTLKLSIVHVNGNYTVQEFTVSVKLVEDRGNTVLEDEAEPETTRNFFNPFD